MKRNYKMNQKGILKVKSKIIKVKYTVEGFKSRYEESRRKNQNI